MVTHGQIELLACEVVNKFLQTTIGRGAANVTATLRHNALFVHLQDVLTLKEQSLAAATAADPHRGEAIVREMRDLLVRRSRAELMAALGAIVGEPPSAVLHDVDPTTGDEVVAFLFGRSPPVRARGRPAP